MIAQRKLYEAEAEVKARNLEKKSVFACQEINQEFECQGRSGSKRQDQFVWRIGVEEKTLSRKSFKRLPRNRRVEKKFFRKDRSSKTCKSSRIVLQQQRNLTTESLVGTNSGFTEHSKFNVRRNRFFTILNQLWSDPRS